MVVPPLGQVTNHYLYGVARLRPGITIAQASDAVRRMCAAINQSSPNPNNARAAYMPPFAKASLWICVPKILVIVGAALCALLIAAANFAGLLLTRVIEREGEFASTRGAWRELASLVPATNHPGHCSRTCRDNGRPACRFVDYTGTRCDESGRRGCDWQCDA